MALNAFLSESTESTLKQLLHWENQVFPKTIQGFPIHKACQPTVPAIETTYSEFCIKFWELTDLLIKETLLSCLMCKKKSVDLDLGWTPKQSGEYVLKLYVMDATTMGAVLKNPIVNNIYVEPANTSLASGPESTKN